MKTKTIRVLVPIAVGVVALVAFIAHFAFGTPSGFGLGDISLICPLGALGTMIASKTLVPRAVISLVAVLVFVLIFGRAFCGWMCPIPVTRKIPALFKGKKKGDAAAAEKSEATSELDASIDASVQRNVKSGCASCASKVDTRHFVLGGALLSTAVFGFPVFCLVCPIGLSFATLFLVANLFGTGDLTWGIIAAPALLVLELAVFRKWCSKICPLSALMSLAGLVNSKVLRPKADASKCIEADGVECGRCHAVCEVDIDPRHPERGAGFNECLKCRACVDVCPGKAIEMPLLPKK